jgi:hypothetical protein
MNRQYTSTGSSASSGAWLFDIARRQPEALLLMAAGCALLMRGGNGKGGRRSYARGDFDVLESERGSRHASGQGIGQRLSQSAQSAAEYASDMGGRVADTASAYAESVSDLATDAGRSISEGSERLARQAQSTFQSGMDRLLRDQPLAVAAIGLAAGAAVAAAFPSTDIESRTLGGAREALGDAMEKAEGAMVDAAGKAGERLKSMAAEGLVGLAGQAASAFTEAGSATEQSGAAGQRATGGRDFASGAAGARSTSSPSGDTGLSGRKSEPGRSTPRPGGGGMS